jgi:hypothetical protein
VTLRSPARVWLSSLASSFGHGEAKEWRLSVFKVFCVSNVPEFVSSHIKTLELRKKSNSTANAFVPPVRADVTFVWESVRNYVIWIVYLINIHYITIR